MQAVRHQKQQHIADYKAARGCTDCGESDPIVLELDHLDPQTKDPRLRSKGGPARWKWGLTLLSWAGIAAELGMCEVVCSNCHKRREHKRGYRNQFSPVTF